MVKKKASQPALKKPKEKQPLAGSFKLAWRSFGVINKFWRPLLGIVLVYLLLNIVFASGLSSFASGVDSINQNLHSHSVGSALGGFGLLIGSAGSSGSSTGSTLQIMLFIIESLVIIWALRHLLAGKEISIKQAYYHAGAPLVPFLLVIAILILQLLPITFGGSILAAILSSALINNALANAIFIICFVALAGWSFYMLSSSVFALYIVTLPDMQPRVALRSAKKLVSKRRAIVMRRVLFLPLLIFVVITAIMLPVIWFATSFAAPTFYLLSMFSILFVHTYLYSLYRELIV